MNMATHINDSEGGSRPAEGSRRSPGIVDLTHDEEDIQTTSASRATTAICLNDIPEAVLLSCLSFLSPRDLLLGYGLTSKASNSQSLDDRLTPFSPTVRFRVKPAENVRHLILRMLKTLHRAFRGSRDRLEILDLINIAPTSPPTSAEYEELWAAVTTTYPLRGVRHVVIPRQRSMSFFFQFVHHVLRATPDLESYECQARGGAIWYDYLSVSKHCYLRRFRSNDHFLEGSAGFHVRGTAISDISIEKGVFKTHALRSGEADTEGGGDQSCFLLTDHGQLERVNIEGARSYVAHLYEYVPVPQLILMDFVRKNKSLRWIKCDLTPENVYVMKQERPEVQFVSSFVV